MGAPSWWDEARGDNEERPHTVNIRVKGARLGLYSLMVMRYYVATT